MLYPIPVRVRTFQRLGRMGYTMSAVVNSGTIGEMDGIGYYLIGGGRATETDIRMQLGTAVEGTIVVRADSVFQAINRLYREINHPGIIGTGGEKDGENTKAIYRDDICRLRPIWELPECDLDECYSGGCFSISPEGWAKCRYVDEDEVNIEHGYSHCILQDAREAMSGCTTEAYMERACWCNDKVETDDAGIQYVPFMPELYRSIAREFDSAA